MASDQARRFLETLQGSIYADLGLPGGPGVEEYMRQTGALDRLLEAKHWMSAGERAEAREQALQKIEGDLYRQLPTRYEDPGWYMVLTDLAALIESAAAERSLDLPPRPLLGTLPTGQVNAMTIVVPSSDEHVIVFESQLFQFVLMLSKAVVRALPVVERGPDGFAFSTHPERVRSNLGETPEAAQRFSEVLHAYVLQGRPGAAPQYLAPEPWATAAHLLCDSMELFVLGHEYGHLIAGHLAEGRGSAGLLGHQEVDRIFYSWNQELEADVWGLRLAVPAMQKSAGTGTDPSMSFWGPDFFFSCVDVVGRALAVLVKGDEASPPSESHPPPQLRRQVLRQVIARSLPEAEARYPLVQVEALQTIVEHLWEITRPAFLRLHRQGMRPAPSWL